MQRRLDDFGLVQQLSSDAAEFANAFEKNERPVLAEVMKQISETIDAIVIERVLTDQHIEKK